MLMHENLAVQILNCVHSEVLTACRRPALRSWRSAKRVVTLLACYPAGAHLSYSAPCDNLFTKTNVIAADWRSQTLEPYPPSRRQPRAGCVRRHNLLHEQPAAGSGVDRGEHARRQEVRLQVCGADISEVAQEKPVGRPNDGSRAEEQETVRAAAADVLSVGATERVRLRW